LKNSFQLKQLILELLTLYYICIWKKIYSFYIIKNVNWFIIFQSYNLLLIYLILKINLSHQDPINYHVSNTFHSNNTHLYFLIHFFLFIFINLSIVLFCNSTKSSTFFLKFWINWFKFSSYHICIFYIKLKIIIYITLNITYKYIK